MPFVEYLESTENSWGLQQMLEHLSGDRGVKVVQITLGCWRLLVH